MSNNLCNTKIKEQICQIFSAEKNPNSETKDFGFRNNLTLDYLIDKLPLQRNADNTRDTILKDYLFCMTDSISGNVVDDLVNVLSNQNPVNCNNEMQDSIVINPNILIAANNYLDILRNEKVIKIIEKANQKEHLKTVIFLDEIYSMLNDEFADKFIEESQNIEECAGLMSRYSKELSALSNSDSNLKSSYQILTNLPSDFTLKSIKQIKKINQEVTDSSIDYKIISKNPKLIKKINAVKGRYNNLKRRTSSWLDKELNIYLEKEYKKINFNISRMTDLDLAIEKTDNASRQLNKIKNKYKAAGITPAKFNKKYSQLSAQQNKLKSYNALKEGFVKNCAIIKRDRQLIEDIGVDDIADLVLLIDKEKRMLKNADLSETKFSDLDTAKQDYINESKRFKDAVNLEISSIKQYLNYSCDILIRKADKYTGMSGLFANKDQESLIRLKDEAKRLNDQILSVKNEFGIADYVIKKSNELGNLVDKLIRKNTYTSSQKLTQSLNYKFAEARLLAFNYLPSEEVPNAKVFPIYQESDKYNIIQKGNKAPAFEQNWKPLPFISNLSNDYIDPLKQRDNKTSRKTYSQQANRKNCNLFDFFIIGAVSLIITAGVYFNTDCFKTKSKHQQVSGITSTVKYNQNQTKSVPKQITIKKPQYKNIKRYVEQMHEKYESRFTEIRQRFDMADTEKKYDFAQKQLDSLKSEMKQFMGSEIYQNYKSGKV